MITIILLIDYLNIEQQQPLFIHDKNIKANKLVGSCTNKIHKKLQLKIKIILIKYNFDKNK